LNKPNQRLEKGETGITIHLHGLLDVPPGMIDEYVDAAASHVTAGWKRYVKTVGFLKNAFRHREAFALRQYDCRTGCYS
jgi:hypothetical protein